MADGVFDCKKQLGSVRFTDAESPVVVRVVRDGLEGS